MRTDPDIQKALYNWITLQEAGRRLSVTPDHVLALAEAGQLVVEDYRIPGAKRGVYRVDPESVETFRADRRVGKVA